MEIVDRQAKGFLTIHPSDLMFKVYKVYHKSDTYVKCKVMYFYKSSGDICYWLNPEGKPKTYKIIRSVYDNFTSVSIKY